MKYLKTFESNKTNNARLIEDFFLDISDTHSIRRVKSPSDKDFQYRMRSYGGTILRALNLVNLRESNINGSFIIVDQSSKLEEKYSLVLKYTRGSLKFPDFGEDIGIFRNRLIDEGFDVDIIRGSGIKDHMYKSNDEIYLEFKISKKVS